ncbi:hypothetical protein HYC85_009236 [Camellia sinensis]|uniref:Uncharacterized protein n=1 Tax=Camellia sinensis TaxID=4442 RepID=A0A7J7HEE9_CAMSI|nr:hypothetical protein HYC85_009236 [Camellia sinensis]
MERIEGASSLVHSRSQSCLVTRRSQSFTLVLASSLVVHSRCLSLRRRSLFTLVNLRMPSFTLLHPGTE